MLGCRARTTQVRGPLLREMTDSGGGRIKCNTSKSLRVFLFKGGKRGNAWSDVRESKNVARNRIMLSLSAGIKFDAKAEVNFFHCEEER